MDEVNARTKAITGMLLTTSSFAETIPRIAREEPTTCRRVNSFFKMLEQVETTKRKLHSIIHNGGVTRIKPTKYKLLLTTFIIDGNRNFTEDFIDFCLQDEGPRHFNCRNVEEKLRISRQKTMRVGGAG